MQLLMQDRNVALYVDEVCSERLQTSLVPSNRPEHFLACVLPCYGSSKRQQLCNGSKKVKRSLV